MSEEQTPTRPGEHPAVVQLVHLALISAVWRGDDFAITLHRGGAETSEVPTPPAELWEGIFERIDDLTAWTGPRTGLIRLDLEGKLVDCHVLARRRDLRHREIQLLFEAGRDA